MDSSARVAPEGASRQPVRPGLRRAAGSIGAVTGVVLGLTLSSAPASAAPAPDGPVLRWSAVTAAAAAAACLSPGNPAAESRLYAMTQIAVHDALNAIHPRFTTYTPGLFAPSDASVDAAVAAATHTVALAVFGKLRDSASDPCGARGAAVIEREYVAVLGRIAEGPEKQAGLAIGRKAATSIVERRRDDATPTTNPGTASAPTGIRPFDPDAATCVPPALAGATVNRGESRPASWNRQARGIAARRHLDTWQEARFLALLNIAQADGYALGRACEDAGAEPLLGRYHPPVLSDTGRVIP